ncbi:toxin YdaT domain-containing protein, partial [Escherichia coli]|nr:toxin YdaT domain-containing protein [Escherichia coli]
WRQQGGEEIDFPDDISRARQKLFRYLDNPTESERYRENVRLLTPAIMAVLPLEYRHRLLPEESFMSRLARLEKETSEAKVAV